MKKIVTDSGIEIKKVYTEEIIPWYSQVISVMNPPKKEKGAFSACGGQCQVKKHIRQKRNSGPSKIFLLQPGAGHMKGNVRKLRALP